MRHGDRGGGPAVQAAGLVSHARRIKAESGGGVLIATAHTKDDLLETTLMRILRGAGPSGLAAMPRKRGRLFRPLLELSRCNVLDYLREKNIPWREDATNADSRFLRNRIRHRLIPLLDESFPQWRAGLSSLAQTQSLAAAFIQSEAALRVKWGNDGGGAFLRTDAENFFCQPEIVREEALFQGINLLTASRRAAVPREMKRFNIRRFSRDKTAADLGTLHLAGDSRYVSILSRSRSSEYGFSLLINAPGSYTLKGVTIEAKSCCQHECCQHLCCHGSEDADGFYAFLPLVLRLSCKDDCVTGGGKKISWRKIGTADSGVICAEDKFGPAAFISSGGLLLSDDETVRRNAAPDVFCVVKTASNKS